MRSILRSSLGALLPRPVKRAIRQRLYAFATATFHGRPGPDFHFEILDETAELFIDDVQIVLPSPFSVRSTEWLLSHPEDVLELQVFLKIAKQANGIMFDVGAHIGTFAVLFCKVCSHNAVAFEPHPDALSRIEGVAALNQIRPMQIQVVEAAAGSSVGITKMHLDEVTGFTQVQKYSSSRDRGGASVNVALTTVDKVRAALDAKVELLKIDVEGFEDEVLNGAQDTLARDRPIISLELHSDYLRERGINSRAVLAELWKQDYSLIRLNGSHLPVRASAMAFALVPRAHLLAVPNEQRARYQRIVLGKP